MDTRGAETSKTGAVATRPEFDLLAQPPAGKNLTTLVRSLLPPNWSAAARVVLAPGGFAFGFREAEGASHVLRVQGLEVEFWALAQGQYLNVSYLWVGTTPPDAATLTLYHAVADALLAKEGQLAEDLYTLYAKGAGGAGGVGGAGASAGQPGAEPRVGDAQPRFDFLAHAPVDDALAASVRALLPPDWRGDVQVVLAPGGLAVEFKDAAGAAHVLRAQGLESGFAPLAQGQRVTVSYLMVGTTPADEHTLARYRAVAEAILPDEDELMTVLVTPEEAAPGFDLAAPPSAGEPLATRVRALLPPDWRADARVMQAPAGFMVGMPNPAGGVHVLRAQGLESGFWAVAQGRRLGVSYLAANDAAADDATVARYRAVASALLAKEEALAKDLQRKGAATPGTRRPGPGFDLQDHPPADEALTVAVRTWLPADWRSDVTVVLAPGGFAMGSRDATGTAHVLRVQGLEAGFAPLAQGQRLIVSYLAPDAAPPADDATLTNYRAVASALLAEEPSLLAALVAPGETPPGFDLATQPVASADFTARVRALLPVAWRTDAQVVRAPGGFAVGFRDATGAAHVLRAQGLEAGFRPLAQGQRLIVSYLAPPDPSQGTSVGTSLDASMGTATASRYRDAAAALLATEDTLARDLQRAAKASHGAASPPPGAVPPAHGFDLHAHPPADPALVASVCAGLPADWRASATVVLAPGGFAVGFRDAAGRAHVLRAQGLDEGFRPLAQGQRLNLLYQAGVNQPTSAVMVAHYRAAAETLLGQEDTLLEALLAQGAFEPLAPGADELPPGFDLRRQPPANEALAARVRAALPEGARADAQVVQAPSGFMVGFRDADRAHVLRAQGLEAGFRPIAQGRRLGVSYLAPPDPTPDPSPGASPDPSPGASPGADALVRYQGIAKAILAKEDALARNLQRKGPAPGGPGEHRPGFNLQDHPPADDALTAEVLAWLPADWRSNVRVVLAPGGFAVGFHDATGRAHVLRAQGLEAGFAPLTQGQHLIVSYLAAEEAPPDADSVARYRAVAEALLAEEEALVEAILPPPPVPRERNRR